MRRACILAIAFLVVLSAEAVGQYSAPAPQILLLEPGSRPAGMGNCYVAVADDAWGCFWNPAGLPFIKERVSSHAMYSELLPDWGGLDYWSAAVALRTEHVGAFALAWTHLSYGEIPVDPYGESMFDAWEWVRSLAYGLAPIDNLGLGINVKQVESRVIPPDSWEGTEGIATMTALDIGAMYRFKAAHGPWEALYRVGVCAQHLGGSMVLEGYPEADKTEPPRNLKLGASCLLRGQPYVDALLCFEYNRSLVDSEDSMFYSEDPILGFGLELRTSLDSQEATTDGALPSDVLAVRLGYVHDEDGEVKGFSFGLGITFNTELGPFSFDFANVPQAEGLSRPWRIGGGIGLGT